MNHFRISILRSANSLKHCFLMRIWNMTQNSSILDAINHEAINIWSDASSEQPFMIKIFYNNNNWIFPFWKLNYRYSVTRCFTSFCPLHHLFDTTPLPMYLSTTVCSTLIRNPHIVIMPNEKLSPMGFTRIYYSMHY